MVRRLTLEEPPSRLAIWSSQIGTFALAVALLAVVIVRGGFVEAVPGMRVLGGALALAALAVLLAIGAFAVIWSYGNPGFGRALLAFVIGSALLTYPAYVLAKGYSLPAIADITTDPRDPPRFDAIARVRPASANPTAYAGEAAAEPQRAAYPDIAPLVVAATPDEAFRAALDVVTRNRWRVVDARPPQPGGRDGSIEAVARTPVMGIREDVVVRVRPAGTRVTIDIRSASRYGTRDFGSNAARIRALLEEIDAEIGS